MSRRLGLLGLLALLLLLAVPAGASAAQPQFSMSEIESELMCPTCHQRLDISHSPAADRIRAYIEEKRDAGWTKQQVKDSLVADFGESILAAPQTHGIGLAAWLVPIAVVLGGIAVVVALVVAWRRRDRAAVPPPAADGAPLPDDVEARLDDALAKFD